jgi:GTP cyclohydrolase IA
MTGDAPREAELAQYIAAILRVLDVPIDHNTMDTPARVARMFVREICAGLYTPRPELTDFPNVRHVDEILAVGPIAVRSCCAHHLVPIIGQA